MIDKFAAGAFALALSAPPASAAVYSVSQSVYVGSDLALDEEGNQRGIPPDINDFFPERFVNKASLNVPSRFYTRLDLHSCAPLLRLLSCKSLLAYRFPGPWARYSADLSQVNNRVAAYASVASQLSVLVTSTIVVTELALATWRARP